MSYHDIDWPFGFGEGSSGGGFTRTLITAMPSGDEKRVQRQQNPRWRYETSLSGRSPERLREIHAFLVARRGNLHTFKVRDPLDYSTAATWQGAVTGTDVQIGIGDGATTRFQMVKIYEPGDYEYVRALRRPRLSTLITMVDGVLVTDRTLDGDTGEIIFGTAPTDGGVVTAGCEFDVIVRADLPDEWIRWQWASGHKLGMGQLQFLEELNPPAVVGESFSGGSIGISMSATVQAVTPAVAALWRLTPNGTSRRIILPNPMLIPDGRDILRIHNAGPQTMTIEDHLGNSLGSLASAETAFVDLLRESDGDLTWMVVVA